MRIRLFVPVQNVNATRYVCCSTSTTAAGPFQLLICLVQAELRIVVRLSISLLLTNGIASKCESSKYRATRMWDVSDQATAHLSDMTEFRKAINRCTVSAWDGI